MEGVKINIENLEVFQSDIFSEPNTTRRTSVQPERVQAPRCSVASLAPLVRN
jgi:hypothetical protein